MKHSIWIFLFVLLHTLSASADCETQLRQKICFRNESQLKHFSISSTEYNLKYMQETCDEAAPIYMINELIYEYKNLPAQFKKLMCSLKKIIIFDDIFPDHTAQIIPHLDKSTVETRTYQRMDQKFVREISGLQNGVSMRIYQGVFGMDIEKKSNEKLKNTFKKENTHNHSFDFNGVVSQIPYILVHELAHVLDEYNEINPCTPYLDFYCYKQDVKAELPESFAEISWKYDAHEIGLVSLKKESKLARNKITSDFNQIKSTQHYVSVIEKSEFVSSYATFNPLEDFAETVSHYFMHTHYEASKTLKASSFDYKSLDLYAPRPSLKTKLKFVEDVLHAQKLKFGPETKKFKKIHVLYKSFKRK